MAHHSTARGTDPVAAALERCRQMQESKDPIERLQLQFALGIIELEELESGLDAELGKWRLRD